MLMRMLALLLLRDLRRSPTTLQLQEDSLLLLSEITTSQF